MGLCVIAALRTSLRHGLTRLEDSTIAPWPINRLLPCGAAVPNTAKE
jgi:hypothetical protein